MALRWESTEVRDVFEWRALASVVEERGGGLRVDGPGEAEPPSTYPAVVTYWRAASWRAGWAGRQARLIRERAEELRQQDLAERRRLRQEQTAREIAQREAAIDAAFADAVPYRLPRAWFEAYQQVMRDDGPIDHVRPRPDQRHPPMHVDFEITQFGQEFLNSNREQFKARVEELAQQYEREEQQQAWLVGQRAAVQDEEERRLRDQQRRERNLRNWLRERRPHRSRKPRAGSAR
jgi:hypothetical protein